MVQFEVCGVTVDYFGPQRGHFDSKWLTVEERALLSPARLPCATGPVSSILTVLGTVGRLRRVVLRQEKEITALKVARLWQRVARLWSLVHQEGGPDRVPRETLRVLRRAEAYLAKHEPTRLSAARA